MSDPFWIVLSPLRCNKRQPTKNVAVKQRKQKTIVHIYYIYIYKQKSRIIGQYKQYTVEEKNTRERMGTATKRKQAEVYTTEDEKNNKREECLHRLRRRVDSSTTVSMSSAPACLLKLCLQAVRESDRAHNCRIASRSVSYYDPLLLINWYALQCVAKLPKERPSRNDLK